MRCLIFSYDDKDRFMPHFYVPPERIANGRFILEGEEAHHLLHVRRCKPGMIIRIFDGTGKSYSVEIDQVSKTGLSGAIVSEETAASTPVALHLYQAVPKGDRFDWLVEKAAEAGVKSIIPLITGRSVITEISPQKLERWRRLSKAASQQSARADMLEIADPLALTAALTDVNEAALNIIPWESEDTGTVADAIAARSSFTDANVFIGPEGGFTLQEIEAAKAKGVAPVTLGARILRAETAGLLASILVLNSAGEYGRPAR
jgi:16S rRNA (uracil1498-N3)-methyltransferase